jgi:hypothetical protein
MPSRVAKNTTNEAIPFEVYQRFNYYYLLGIFLYINSFSQHNGSSSVFTTYGTTPWMSDQPVARSVTTEDNTKERGQEQSSHALTIIRTRDPVYKRSRAAP